MEKQIIVLLQLIEQKKTEEAKRYSVALLINIDEAIDNCTTDENLVRLSKMQKIVSDIQQQLNN